MLKNHEQYTDFYLFFIARALATAITFSLYSPTVPCSPPPPSLDWFDWNTTQCTLGNLNKTKMADDIPFVDQEELPDINYDPRGEINNFNHKNLVAGLGIRPVVVPEGSSHQTVPQELILAVFVVHFDTRKG